MRIAQVAPLHESVPPKCYGGTERIVHYLTESLVALGHEVTLFASGDSRTSADLCPSVPEALRLARQKRDPTIQHLLQLAEVARHADKFDIVHFHTDYLHFPTWRFVSTPQVTTLHGRLDLPELRSVFEEFSDLSVVSISDSQRAPLPMANWLQTVYNGVPADSYDFVERPGAYLVFLGRISPEKGPEQALRIAARAGLPLKLAAKIDAVDQDYFASRIRPWLKSPQFEYIGEVNESEKNQLLGGALATLFPIDWPEPFGLVMIESLACGTPVIAYNRGSVPEVMRDGITGFIVQDEQQAGAALERVHTIRRSECRAHFEERFSAETMARNYLAAYAKAIGLVWPSRARARDLFQSPALPVPAERAAI